MKLPRITARDNRKRRVTDAFGGYHHSRIIGEGELFDGENLSSDAFPLLTARRPRGTVRTLTKANGIFAKEKLCFVDATALYYGDKVVGRVADSEKTFASMGAYLLIFPDKLCLNTETEELQSLENRYTGAAGKLSFTEKSIVTTGDSFTGFRAYDGVTISGCSVALNNKTAIVTAVADKELTFSDKCFTAASEAGAVTIAREVPSLTFLVESDNRLWGCAGREILASKLGDPFNWHCFEGLSTDSYAVTVGTEGAFTGAAVHQGYVLFFKETCIHKLYGSKPANFQVAASAGQGVRAGAAKSLCTLGGVLYYLSPAGVVGYGGGVPESLAAPFGGVAYAAASGGAYREKYYLSMQEADSGSWSLFAYDTGKGIWQREDATNARGFAECGGQLFYLDGADSTIKTVVGSDAGRVLWEAEFGNLSGGEPNLQTVSHLQINIELARGAFCEVWLRYDGNADWERAFSVPESARRRTWSLPVIPRLCGQFSLKLAGGGEFLLFSIARRTAACDTP